MTDAYNITELGTKTNWVQWFIVFNDWSNGIFFGGICIALWIIMFTVAKSNLVSNADAAIGSSFVCMLVSVLFWVISASGVYSISTLVPVLFIMALGISIFFKAQED